MEVASTVHLCLERGKKLKLSSKKKELFMLSLTYILEA